MTRIILVQMNQSDAPMKSLIEAAKMAGVSKSTMLRAVKNGRISAHRTENGSFEIDPAEIARGFPDAPPLRQMEQGELPMARVERLEILLAAAEQRIAELVEDRDQWREQAKRLVLAAPAPQRSGLLSRLFSRSAA